MNSVGAVTPPSYFLVKFDSGQLAAYAVTVVSAGNGRISRATPRMVRGRISTADRAQKRCKVESTTGRGLSGQPPLARMGSDKQQRHVVSAIVQQAARAYEARSPYPE
jgi:hypothetical protein